MTDKLVSSLAARDKLRGRHEALSSEFDKADTTAERKHEINGEMSALRWAMREVETLDDKSPPPKKEDD